MKLKRMDASIDRQILTGMVVSDKFLKAIQPIYRSELLMTPFTITVADWCIDYLSKYSCAPGKHIQDIYKSKHREGSLDDDQADLISEFLTGLSDEYERKDKFNVEYLLDQAERLFRQRSLKYLAEDINAMLATGELEEAENALSDYKKLERPVSMGINPLDSMEAYQKAFESREEPLFRLPGAYGEMVNPHFVRSGFVAFLGRAKIGKTWRLMDIAFRAVKERCNVAMFQVGDLSQNDYMLRQGVHLAKKSNDKRYCGDIYVPILDCELNQNCGEGCPNKKNGVPPVHNEEGELDMDLVGKHEPCTDCQKEHSFRGAVWYTIRKKVKPLEWREAWKATQVWRKRYRANGFMLSTHSNSSINVAGIEAQLDLWEQYNNFVPDVILIDYADILAPEDARKEKRHQEDERWRALRRMSQDRHCLVITVTQTNRGGFGEETVKVENIGEDKRKLDHVTALFSLNQNEKEEEAGIVRIGNLLVREGKRDVMKQVRILQSLETGQPYIASYNHYPKKKGGGK